MTRPSAKSGALAQALEVAQHWPIFPCSPLDKKPLVPKSEGGRGFRDATKDPEQIRAWWKRWPNAMMGVPTGPVSGFWVLDLDVAKEEGDPDTKAAWNAWVREMGCPVSRVHETPSGGRHVLFLWRDHLPIPSSTNKLMRRMDVRGEGGYVVVPPSRTSDGRAYVSNETPIVDAPQWLYDKILGNEDDRVAREKRRRDRQQRGAYTEKVEVEMVREALRVIPADSYDDWYKIGAAIRNELGPNGFGVFEEWSRKSKKYDPAACREKWDQVSNVGDISAGTIFHYADEADPEWWGRWERQQATGGRQSQIKIKKLFPKQEETIPVRPWLIPGLLLRRCLTLTAAPGGTGKSILSLCVAIMCALGRAWSEWKPRGKYKVLIINAEEDSEEQERRAVAVAARAMELPDNSVLSENVMIAENPSDIIVARYNARTRSMTREPLADQLKQLIKNNKIDIVIVDPFAETFLGEETNTELKWVGSLWREIARETDTAIWLIHHTRKYASEMAGDMEASRGGTALGNIVRIGTTMFPMTKLEAGQMEIPEEERLRYVRFDDAKANYHMQSARAQWFKSETVNLQNQTPELPGDNVGVLLPWQAPPTTMTVTTPEKLREVLAKIDQGIRDKKGNPIGDYYTLRSTQKATDTFNRWVGLFLMAELEINERLATNLVRDWAKRNVLVEFSYKTPRRKMSLGCGTPALRDQLAEVPDAQDNLL